MAPPSESIASLWDVRRNGRRRNVCVCEKGGRCGSERSGPDAPLVGGTRSVAAGRGCTHHEYNPLAAAPARREPGSVHPGRSTGERAILADPDSGSGRADRFALGFRAVSSTQTGGRRSRSDRSTKPGHGRSRSDRSTKRGRERRPPQLRPAHACRRYPVFARHPASSGTRGPSAASYVRQPGTGPKSASNFWSPLSTERGHVDFFTRPACRPAL